ncbi:MAG TPA: D-arabinono-1,4-lactone oxidase [Myxococcus sp.]|nr:D-arabinono-1,4-lactone oxidase [Myxococcus sp.]
MTQTRARRIARTWRINTLNSLVYLASGGTKTLHEGRFAHLRGTWSNWNRTFECQSDRFETPRTEEEIQRLVRDSEKVRVAGSGHSFNACPLTQGTLLSLDAYNQLLEVDPASKAVRVQAGARLRDFTEELLALGLALPVLGSTNAQSLGALVGTDLHGTGREHGFLSEQVLSLRVVDASGEARTFRRGSPELHAVVGAIGTCGVVTELELQCVPAFNLEKEIRVVERQWAEDHLEQLLAENDHVSFYYIGGADVRHVRMNLWNRTSKAPSRLLRPRKMAAELLDMLLSGYLLGVARALKLAEPFARLGLLFMRLLENGRKAVFPSAAGFSRKLFYHHDEIEYGVPYEVHRPCLDEVLRLLEQRRFVSIVEVRFTPATSQGLIGPGAGRRTCFIELAPSLSLDASAIFAEAEHIFLKYGGQVHLGKATRATAETMARMHGARWHAFRSVQKRQDPHGKFVNDFVARVFGASRVQELESSRPSQEAHGQLAS